MADMKKLAEEQLEEITGGIILSRINEPSFQVHLPDGLDRGCVV